MIPFVALAVGAAAGLTGPGPDPQGWYRHALVAYGAVILSFVGALHWGFAMTLDNLPDARRNHAWLWSVVPALLAWIALLLSGAAATAVIVTGFVAQYAEDGRMARKAALPAWYLPLRFRLTAVACVALAVGALVR